MLPNDLNWFNAETIQAYEDLADMSSSAQVHPFSFTNCIAKLAKQGGTKMIIGMVEHINCSDIHNTSENPAPLTSFQDLTQKRVVSVTYTDKATSEKHTILATTVVLAAGPWSPMLLPKVQMAPLRAHSVTMKLKEPLSAYCLSTNIALSGPSRSSTNPDPSSTLSRTVCPETYARPNNEVYICGQGDFNAPLPLPNDAVEVSLQSCQEIIDAATSISDELRNGQITGKRACYLPGADIGIGNGPLVGRTDLQGLLLETRHSCWGVLNEPATGKVISELIFDGEVSCIDAENLGPTKIL